MNNAALLLGAIFLVVGVMGYMFTSDQADICEKNALNSVNFWNHYYNEKYSTYKLYSYLLAGLSVLGGVMCAAGIFTTPKPAPAPDPTPTSEQPKKIIDEATKKEYKAKYIRSGWHALAIAFLMFCLAFLLSPFVPLLCQFFAGFGFLAAIYGVFIIIVSYLAL